MVCPFRRTVGLPGILHQSGRPRRVGGRLSSCPVRRRLVV